MGWQMGQPAALRVWGSGLAVCGAGGAHTHTHLNFTTAFFCPPSQPKDVQRAGHWLQDSAGTA